MDYDSNTINQNGYIISIIGGSKVVFLNYQKYGFINPAINWEWMSLIKAIGINDYWSLLFLLLKSKR